jgi:mono/diheme cytochrome c family protein
VPHALSLALGIAFVVLAIALVLLQAWLWNPKYWDAALKKSNAPPRWMRVHRVLGYVYAGIYVVMMWHMVPRLWGYAIELPARTVVHAVCAIVIGVVLATKIAILRWFRHFEESMPTLGFVLLVSTVLLASLSIPFGLRAYSDVALDEDDRARVDRILANLDDPPADAHALSEPASLGRGRDVLTTQCTQCHDVRTILAEPRTGASWRSLVERMAAKPNLGLEITDTDAWATTAYLVSITPGLQEASAARYAEKEHAREAETPAVEEAPDSGTFVVDASVEVTDAAVLEALDGGVDAGVRRPRPRRRIDAGVSETATPDAVPDAGPASGPTTVVPPDPPTLVYSTTLARGLLDRRCTDCHGLDELDTHGGDDRDGWSAVLRRMVARGAPLTSDEMRVLARYLVETRP